MLGDSIADGECEAPEENSEKVSEGPTDRNVGMFLSLAKKEKRTRTRRKKGKQRAASDDNQEPVAPEAEDAESQSDDSLSRDMPGFVLKELAQRLPQSEEDADGKQAVPDLMEVGSR